MAMPVPLLRVLVVVERGVLLVLVPVPVPVVLGMQYCPLAVLISAPQA